MQMEGIGHIPMLKIPDYVRYLRKEIYIPFMPLGPIVSDRTSGQDHITAAVGAAYMATLGGGYYQRCYKGGTYWRDTDHPLNFGGY